MSSTSSVKVSPTRLRLLEPTDSRRIYSAIEQNRLSKGRSISVREALVSKLCCTKTAVKNIIAGEIESLIVDEAYLVCYSLGMPWFTTELILKEEMILRIGDGSNFSAVTDLLDDLAAISGANTIIVGGAFARAPVALIRMYSRAGYALEDKPVLVKRR